MTTNADTERTHYCDEGWKPLCGFANKEIDSMGFFPEVVTCPDCLRELAEADS